MILYPWLQVRLWGCKILCVFPDACLKAAASSADVLVCVRDRTPITRVIHSNSSKGHTTHINTHQHRLPLRISLFLVQMKPSYPHVQTVLRVCGILIVVKNHLIRAIRVINKMILIHGHRQVDPQINRACCASWPRSSTLCTPARATVALCV
jgi:hypothetical protein